MFKVREESKMLVLEEEVLYHDMVIPKGTKWDGASIPKLFRNILGSPKSPEYIKASLLHDWIYRYHELPKYHGDIIFAYELLKEKTPVWKVMFMMLALGIFGWVGYYWPFKKFKKE
jgi:hypothetical protein